MSAPPLLPAAGRGFRGNILTEQLHPELKTKLEGLEHLLKSRRQVVVLFSGGVDSAFLLKAAAHFLGEGVMALTFQGPHGPAGEMAAAREIATILGVRHQVEVFDPFTLPDFKHNTAKRCYACKRAIFQKALEIAAAEEAEALVDGANADDAAADRPGMLAAAEMGVGSPLREAGLHKNQIREISHFWGLPGWDRPAQSCLATRFPPNTLLDAQNFRKIDDLESWLRERGFGPVRLRVHGDLLRLELPPGQWPGLLEPELKAALHRLVAATGWRYLTLDMSGYQSGSMNLRAGEAE
jgi:uncharacterized protein